MNHDDLSTADRLFQATEALSQTPGANELPPEMILRAERIPFSEVRKKSHWIGWIVAAVIVLSLGGVAFFLLQRTSEIAFADVVQSVSSTHTLTAIEDDAEPMSPNRGMKFYARDNDVRFETATWIQVINHKTGQHLYLYPDRHLASVENNIKPANSDLYQILRDYHGKNAQPLGDKMIDGQAVQGFRTVVDDNSPPFNIMIIWVDKTSKLPVRMENGPIVMRDLHFDVPVADSLFDTAIPAGYTVLKPYSPAETFQFAGQVIDDQGNPVANVDVWATQHAVSATTRPSESLGPGGTTDRSGHFAIDCSLAFASDNPIRLEFKHPDFVYARLEDLRLMPPDMQKHLQVRLNRGRSLTGQVVDQAGQPVAGAIVQSICDPAGAKQAGDTELKFRWDYEKITGTDSQGRFALHGLAGGKLDVHVKKCTPGSILIAQANVNELHSATQPTEPLQLTAKPLELPAGTVVHQLFGMKLIDVNASLRDQLSLNAGDTVLVLDPGASISRMSLPLLSTGDTFWLVNSSRVQNFHEFAQQILSKCEAEEKEGRTEFDVRVVYDYMRADKSASYSFTTEIHLNGDDLAELKNAVQP